MALLELIYTSQSTAASGVCYVQKILESSEVNNTASSITGLLLFDGERYIQVLEGASEEVEKTYEIICEDERHRCVELLHKGVISDRSFKAWHMTYEAIPKGLLSNLAENMGVYSLESESGLTGPGESFGARLNTMFKEAVD